MFELINAALQLPISSIPTLVKNSRFSNFLDRLIVKQGVNFVESNLRWVLLDRGCAYVHSSVRIMLGFVQILCLRCIVYPSCRLLWAFGNFYEFLWRYPKIIVVCWCFAWVWFGVLNYFQSVSCFPILWGKYLSFGLTDVFWCLALDSWSILEIVSDLRYFRKQVFDRKVEVADNLRFCGTRQWRSWLRYLPFPLENVRYLHD